MKPNVSRTDLSRSQKAGIMSSRIVFPVLAAGLLCALTIPFLSCGGASAFAQQDPKMTYSGSNVATTINLQDGTVTDEELFAGDGTQGPFTYRELHADSGSPATSSTCSGPFFPVVTGEGVFRFEDGSLMTVQVTGGGICVDLTTNLGNLSETYQITGGTGKYQGASGTLTLKGVLNPLLFNAAGNPELLTNTGEFEGTISK